MRDTVDPAIPLKHSYTVPCPSGFRDQVEALAARRRVNVADIARSVLLVLPPEAIAAHPDPGEPQPHDRENVVLKSGPSAGRPWRRKPRLQIRMPPGYDIETIRRALALAVALDGDGLRVRLDDPATPPAPPPPPPPPPPPADPYPAVERQRGAREQAQALTAAAEEIERLRAIINVLSFEPLPGGVITREEALHILGFAPGQRPDARTVKAKFRMLATIHHPDSSHGSHLRMSQLNAAIDLLRRG